MWTGCGVTWRRHGQEGTRLIWHGHGMPCVLYLVLVSSCTQLSSPLMPLIQSAPARCAPRASRWSAEHSSHPSSSARATYCASYAFDCPNVSAHCSAFVWSSIVGSGRIHLAGKSDYHNVTIAGSGSLEALDFLVSNYDIQVPGSGECRIHVKDVLNVVIAGSGNVYYRGNPSVINTTISGSGNVIHLG